MVWSGCRISDDDLTWYLGFQRAGFETEAEIIELLGKTGLIDRYERIERAIVDNARVSERYRRLARDPEAELQRSVLFQILNID